MLAASFNAKILANDCVQDSIWKMKVENQNGVESPLCGQFYMLRAWGAEEAPILSRPISVHDFDEKTITFLYEVKGIGTEKIAKLKAGEHIALTGAAGNGFPLKSGKVAVVGGGIGIAPLLALCKALRANGAKVDFYAGYRDAPFCLDDFKAVREGVFIATDSGNYGTKGFVTDLINVQDYQTVYTCGPEIMMQKVARACLKAGVEVFVSKEAKMACGLGACLGCTCKTKEGVGVSVCKDGPVFEGGLLYGID